MPKQLLSFLAALAGLSGSAWAQNGPDIGPDIQELEAAPDPSLGTEAGFPYGPPPIPPNVEEAPLAGPGGGYCYAGPHPVDTRAAAGPAWDDSPGLHTHFYPPIDLRLFALHDGCYTFIGDPVDFGYRGQVYSYYGAHPLLENYGGGWCFMIGPHAHPFQPWSPSFVVVGSWYYWRGAYDNTFWSYWPYYSFYYRSYYPHYYAGGRFFRNHEVHVAPPIRRVPPGNYYRTPGYARGQGGGGQGWRGTGPGYAAPGTAPPSTQWRAPASSGVAGPGGWRGTAPSPAPAPRAGGWVAPGNSGWSHGAAAPQPVAPATPRAAGATFGGHSGVKSGVRR
jgi:hypothetical protein